MQRLALDGVGGFVVDLFAFAAAGYETAGFQELKVMGNRRAGHTHKGGDVNNTFLTMAEKPENLNSTAIAELFKHVGNRLKIGLFEGFLQRFYIIFICMMMGKQFFRHNFSP